MQERAGPANTPPIIQEGIKTNTLEERRAREIPIPKGRNPASVNKLVNKNFLMFRSKTSVYLGNPVRRFPFETYELGRNKKAIRSS